MPLGLSENEKRLRNAHVSVQQSDYVQTAINGGVALKQKTISALTRFQAPVKRSSELKKYLKKTKQKQHWSHPYGQVSHVCPPDYRLVQREFTSFHHVDSDELAKNDWFDERLVKYFAFILLNSDVFLFFQFHQLDK